jgi:hypothetical protein
MPAVLVDWKTIRYDPTFDASFPSFELPVNTSVDGDIDNISHGAHVLNDTFLDILVGLQATAPEATTKGFFKLLMDLSSLGVLLKSSEKGLHGREISIPTVERWGIWTNCNTGGPFCSEDLLIYIIADWELKVKPIGSLPGQDPTPKAIGEIFSLQRTKDCGQQSTNFDQFNLHDKSSSEYSPPSNRWPW